MMMKAALLRTTVVAAALGLVAAGCSGGTGSETTLDASGSTDRDFVASTIDGGELALADYAGQDVMVWFWAPW
jgi:hypothetical protein